MTMTGPPIFAASAGVIPASVGVSMGGGALDCQIGAPGSPIDLRLPCESSDHSTQPARTKRQIEVRIRISLRTSTFPPITQVAWLCQL